MTRLGFQRTARSGFGETSARHRELVPLALALLAHLGLVWTIRGSREAEPSDSRSLTQAEPTTDLDLETSERGPTVEVATAERGPERRATAEASASSRTSHAAERQARSADVTPTAAEASTARTPSEPPRATRAREGGGVSPDGESGGASHPALTLEELGLAGRNRFLAEGAFEEVLPAKSRESAAVETSLRSARRERDVAAGLGPEGPVLAALEASTMRGAAPANGTAIFEAQADASGVVFRIDVKSSNSDATAWREVARDATRTLATVRLRLPSSAKGARLQIEVSSRVMLPNGGDPGLDVSVAGIPLKKGTGPKSPRIAVLDLPSVRYVPPSELPSDSPFKLGTLGILVPLIHARVDPTDLAPARRLVSARVTTADIF